MQNQLAEGTQVDQGRDGGTAEINRLSCSEPNKEEEEESFNSIRVFHRVEYTHFLIYLL